MPPKSPKRPSQRARTQTASSLHLPPIPGSPSTASVTAMLAGRRWAVLSIAKGSSLNRNSNSNKNSNSKSNSMGLLFKFMLFWFLFGVPLVLRNTRHRRPPGGGGHLHIHMYVFIYIEKRSRVHPLPELAPHDSRRPLQRWATSGNVGDCATGIENGFVARPDVRHQSAICDYAGCPATRPSQRSAGAQRRDAGAPLASSRPRASSLKCGERAFQGQVAQHGSVEEADGPHC